MLGVVQAQGRPSFVFIAQGDKGSIDILVFELFHLVQLGNEIVPVPILWTRKSLEARLLVLQDNVLPRRFFDMHWSGSGEAAHCELR